MTRSWSESVTRRRADLPPGANYTAHVQAVAPIVLSHPKD